MRKIDEFSKMIGAMDCFNEVISCGVKNIALGPPAMDKILRDEYLLYCDDICNPKGTSYRECNDALITDLFPTSMNKDKYNIIFFKDIKYFNAYEDLKIRKKRLISENKYDEDQRYRLAYDFGKLLSYKDEDINRMIKNNAEKEVF